MCSHVHVCFVRTSTRCPWRTDSGISFQNSQRVVAHQSPLPAKGGGTPPALPVPAACALPTLPPFQCWLVVVAIRMHAACTTLACVRRSPPPTAHTACVLIALVLLGLTCRLQSVYPTSSCLSLHSHALCTRIVCVRRPPARRLRYCCLRSPYNRQPLACLLFAFILPRAGMRSRPARPGQRHRP